MALNRFYKKKTTDKIWWVNTDEIGTWEFSFDRKRVYNMFTDYPWILTKEQKIIFDEENPFWANFFSNRNQSEGIS